MSTEGSAKSAILRAVQDAVAGAPEAMSISRDYSQRDERSRTTVIEEFIDRLQDYKAHVERVEVGGLSSCIADACNRYGVQRLVAPTDVPPEWAPSGVEVLRDAARLSLAELDGSDAVLTGCAFAIAQTGTIVLDGGARQGRRALSLVPDRHICVVYEDQVLGILPEGIARLAASPARPITLISGPSATSDIELSRVEGVHGPRTLHVILAGESKPVS